MTEHNLTSTQTEFSEIHSLPSSVLHNGKQMRAAHTRLAGRLAVQSVRKAFRGIARGRHGLRNPMVPEA